MLKISKLYVLIANLLLLHNLCSQVLIPKNSRFKFAQTTLGFGLQSDYGGHSYYVNQNIGIKKFDMSTQLSPTFHAGGMHFWGHNELYLSFPILQLLRTKTDSLTYRYKQSDIFGVKIYPWKLVNHKLRPYIGISVSGTDYQQSFKRREISGTNFSKITFPFLFGVSYKKPSYIIEIFGKYNFQNTFQYYISKTQKENFKIPILSIGINYKFLRDGTMAGEKSYYDGSVEEIFEKLKETKKLNSFL